MESRYRKLKVGDVITSNKKGFFRITKIRRRKSENPRQNDANYFFKEFGEKIDPFSPDAEIGSIIESEQILSADYRPKKGKDICDEAYCKKVTEEWCDEKTHSFIQSMNELKSLIREEQP